MLLSHRIRLRRVLPAAMALLALLAAGAAAPAQAQGYRSLGFAEPALLDGCLRVNVLNVQDHGGTVSHYDWVTLRVQNACDSVRRHMLVAFFFLDPNGQPYGTRIWTLMRGEILPPGRAKLERYPVPDPGNLYPARWAVRLLTVDKPRGADTAMDDGADPEADAG